MHDRVDALRLARVVASQRRIGVAGEPARLVGAAGGGERAQGGEQDGEQALEGRPLNIVVLAVPCFHSSIVFTGMHPVMQGTPPDPGREPLVVDLLSAPLTPDLVRAMLHDVIDPELGVNIVDLGLLYDVEAEDGVVRILMTLTTPGCPLSGYLDDQIRDCLAQLPQVCNVEIELVWTPPWGPEAMTDRAREQLGWRD